MIAATFSLVDHDGRPVTEGSYRGRWLLVFFGFTHCRVVCPRTLERLSGVLDLLGEAGARIVPLYISVDPERDSPEAMKAFLAQKAPRFTGLTGTREQIDAAKSSFRVFAKRAADAEDPDGYAVPHTAITYLIDPQGDYVDHFGDSLDADSIAARILAKLER